MGSGASTYTSTYTTKPTALGANGIYNDDLLKVSLDSPEYTNGKPELRYRDAEGRTFVVEAAPEEIIGCFTTLDRAGRVTSAPGRLFRLVVPAAVGGDRLLETSETNRGQPNAASDTATREHSAESAKSDGAAAFDSRSSRAAAATGQAPAHTGTKEIDSHVRRWFFYNDTKNYNMVVTAYFGAYSQLRVLGTEAKMWRELPSGLVIAELVVPPLKTLPLVEGLMFDGYDLRFKALKA